MKIRYPLEREIDALLWDAPDNRTLAARFAEAIGGTVLVTSAPDGATLAGPTYAEFRASHRVTGRDFDRDYKYVAPWWIAWLYRWLPRSVSWYGKKYNDARPPYFLWCIAGRDFWLGWLPARRATSYLYAAAVGTIKRGPRWGVLRYGTKALIL